MATFKEIKPGRKFYQLKTDNYRQKNSKTGKYERILFVYFVIGINEETQMVCASINKMPPQWFSATNYRYWQKENPLEIVNKQITNI